jgi:hypothetical protein
MRAAEERKNLDAACKLRAIGPLPDMARQGAVILEDERNRLSLLKKRREARKEM